MDPTRSLTPYRMLSRLTVESIPSDHQPIRSDLSATHDVHSKTNGRNSDITHVQVPFYRTDTSCDSVIKTSNMTLNSTTNISPTSNSNNVIPYYPTNHTRDGECNHKINSTVNIDSALLSALHDPRERLGLLKLEQSLIEFMNDKSTTSMEVGGPFNSIVLKGTRARTGEVNEYENNIRSNYSSIFGHRSQISQHVECQYYGSRQTSFQRLCLHRLADRFNIVRETTFGSNNCNLNNVSPTLIRLIKVKNSRVPDNLLINLDISSLIEKSSQKDRRCTYENVTGIVTSNVTPSEVEGIEDRLASTHLYDSSSRPASFITNNCGGGKQMKKKVMIMKRRSSGNLQNDSKGDGSYVSTFGTSDRVSHTLKGKNLSDKEKAYAEARARIFNSHQKKSCSLSSPEGTDSLGGVISIPSDSLSFSAGKNINPNGYLPPNDVCVHPSPTPIITSDDGITSQSVLVIQSSSSFFSEHNEVSDESDDGYLSINMNNNNNSSNLPAAATVGATSKVTWRNRRQEESDPDFQRGTPLMVTNMPLGSMVLPTPLRYHPQNTHYQLENTLLTGPPVFFHHSTGYLGYDHSNSMMYQGHSANLCPPHPCLHVEENGMLLRKNHQSQMSFLSSNEQCRFQQPKQNLQCNNCRKYDINKQSSNSELLIKHSSTSESASVKQESSWSLWASTSDNTKNHVPHFYSEKFPALG